MKNRLVFYGLLSTVVCVILCCRVFTPVTGVSLLNFNRIEGGMTGEEVAALLDGLDKRGGWKHGLPIRVANQGCVEDWKGVAGTIQIFYDANDKVVEKEWIWNDVDLVERGRQYVGLLFPQKIRE